MSRTQEQHNLGLFQNTKKKPTQKLDIIKLEETKHKERVIMRKPTNWLVSNSLQMIHNNNITKPIKKTQGKCNREEKQKPKKLYKEKGMNIIHENAT